MIDFFSLSREELASWLQEQSEKHFSCAADFDWVYGKGVLDWEQMSNLSKELRGKLVQSFRLKVLELVRVKESSDQETYKFLWKLSEGSLVESVLICSGTRRTVCVSSQVGCPPDAPFAHPASKDFSRNLRPLKSLSKSSRSTAGLAKGEKVSHVVYMGMGEPLKNYEHVVKSIRLL